MADLAVTAANVKPGTGAIIKRGISGAAIAAGDLIARATNGTYVKADANGTTPTNIPKGFALNSAPGAGQPISYTDNAAAAEGFDATTAGTPYVLSATPGKAAVAGDLVTGMTGSLVGFGQASNKMMIKIVCSGVAVP